MRKVTFVTLCSVALLLTWAASTWANMAFKQPRQLKAAASGVSLGGHNTIALPYHRKAGVSFANAKDLMNDIGFSSVANVQKFLIATDTFQIYTGRKGSGPDFPLAAGEAYFLTVTSDVDYRLIGSHDPGVTISLYAAASGVSTSGANFVALPYNATARSASELRNEIGTSPVFSVQKFLIDSDTFQIYTGTKGSGPDFVLEPGEGYFIRVGSNVTWTPNHY